MEDEMADNIPRIWDDDHA